MNSEINNVVSCFYNRCKGENLFKLVARIRQDCIGISKDKIQSFININREHCLQDPIFSNKSIDIGYSDMFLLLNQVGFTKI